MEMDFRDRNIVIDNILFLQLRILLHIGLVLKFIEILGVDLGYSYIVIFLYMKQFLQVHPEFTSLRHTRLMKNVITRELIKSAKRLPTIGIRRYALMEGTYLSQIACILAMALGVAPMPKPQVPAVMTAAS